VALGIVGKTLEICDVLRASFDYIFIETVGDKVK
jgi:hypothetical protein